MTALGIDIDLREDFLEEVLDAECKCEARHENAGTLCSIKITHRYSSCAPTRLVCGNTTAYVRLALNLDGICGDCNQPVRAHWVVTPA